MEERADDNRLGRYLAARRAVVTPEQVGLPSGPRRRVAGLRREEVALLAGISADYYLRLERGRDRNPSQQVVEALARVLDLDDVEREYLADLAASRPRRRRTRRTDRVPDRLHHLLAAVDVPAFVESRGLDVLAANALATALSPRMTPGHNRLRSLLLDPEERAFQQDWERAVVDMVAAFRHTLGTDVDDDRAIELVGELSLVSARFREVWARQDVRPLAGNTTVVRHPGVGTLRLHRDKLPVDDVVLVLYYADEGSADAEKLRLLGALERSDGEGAHRIAQRGTRAG
ncbi:helix-turn-helix transcriptional regulator [Curtobacterium oceanosedimentum]|uniref:XRE family transcriptional regulator n=1 Tax=Curtobacterium oceanosedimentum TaxID=465820 RepID=A0A147DT95_9MICO|nr:helix-turn-helix transcriptional regulator [Curtobacterium oceanosedimentum]KTR53566.1 XRE family transcriptional regulator [Curtobacterium oceanosedimentum]